MTMFDFCCGPAGFAALGLEHCVANMFLGGLAIVSGAPITPADWLTKNLVPATLGNMVGGALCVATSYAFIYGAPAKGGSGQDDAQHN